MLSTVSSVVGGAEAGGAAAHPQQPAGQTHREVSGSASHALSAPSQYSPHCPCICPGSCVVEKSYLLDVFTKLYIATDSNPVDGSTYELCSDLVDVVIDVSCIYGLSEQDGAAIPYDHESSSAIHLNSGMVLYLREVRGCCSGISYLLLLPCASVHTESQWRPALLTPTFQCVSHRCHHAPLPYYWYGTGEPVPGAGVRDQGGVLPEARAAGLQHQLLPQVAGPGAVGVIRLLNQLPSERFCFCLQKGSLL